MEKYLAGTDVTVTIPLVDSAGKTTVNEQIMSRDVSVKVPLAETTLDNLVATMPGATIVGTGASKKVVVTSGVGVSLLDLAGELRLHPKGLAANDYSEDFVIPLAATSGGLNFAYEVEKERIFDVTFTGYPDPASEELFAIGGAPVVAP